MFKHRKFLSDLDHDTVVGAIAAAEKKSSGQIRLFITHKRVDDPVVTAERHFHRLGLTDTHHRNAIFLFVSPASRKFAVLGDEGIHEKAGDEAWCGISAALEGHFRKGEFTAGLIGAIDRAGDLLALHYPPTPDSINELSDDIETD